MNILSSVKKYSLYSIHLPLYYLSKISPKKKHTWVFGSWFGKKYSDNSKYLFEYINTYKKDINPVWLSTDQETINIIRRKGYRAYYTYSFAGYYYAFFSSVGFITTSTKDLNFYIPQRYIINLWHGIPLKKIMHDDKNSPPPKRGFVKEILCPYTKTCPYYLISASSPTERKHLASAFRTQLAKIKITGLPRNDIFSQMDVDTPNKSKKTSILYMPTHRNEGETDVTNLFINKLGRINSQLQKENATLYIKLHYYHQSATPKENHSNIIFLSDKDIQQDIYPLLSSIDILITDFSSVYFDFLLTERPIIFAPFDMEAYLRNDRELYYEYESVTPGPKCLDWESILLWITKFKNDPEIYKEERIKIKSLFHSHANGNYSENIYTACKKLVK